MTHLPTLRSLDLYGNVESLMNRKRRGVDGGYGATPAPWTAHAVGDPGCPSAPAVRCFCPQPY